MNWLHIQFDWVKFELRLFASLHGANGFNICIRRFELTSTELWESFRVNFNCGCEQWLLWRSVSTTYLWRILMRQGYSREDLFLLRRNCWLVEQYRERKIFHHKFSCACSLCTHLYICPIMTLKLFLLNFKWTVEYIICINDNMKLVIGINKSIFVCSTNISNP